MSNKIAHPWVLNRSETVWKREMSFGGRLETLAWVYIPDDRSYATEWVGEIFQLNPYASGENSRALVRSFSGTDKAKIAIDEHLRTMGYLLMKSKNLSSML